MPLPSTPSSNLLYAGGNFTQIGGNNRTNLAAINTTGGVGVVGKATSWSPGVTGGAVTALAVSADHSVFVGGQVSIIGGFSRPNLAQIDPTSGQADAFNPAPSSYVNALQVAGGELFVGGSFTSMANAAGATPYLCAFNASTGALTTAWNPAVNSTVYALTLSSDGASIYAGGSFGSISGTSSPYAAELSVATSLVVSSAFSPALNSTVQAIAATATDVYLGGAFNNTGPYFVAVNAGTGAADANFADPQLSNNVDAIAVSGSVVGVGGSFTYSQAHPFRGCQAFDLPTITPLATWAMPVIDGGNVTSLAVSDDATPELFIGGDFSTDGGEPRAGVVKVDGATAAVDISFDALLDNSVNCLTAVPPLLYIGSNSTTTAAGQPRLRAAAVDQMTGGAATAFNPQADNNVDVIASSADMSTILVGGSFDYLGWQLRCGLAEIDTTTGRVASWNPGASQTVYSIAYDANTNGIVAGGYMQSLGGSPRSYLGMVDATSGAVSPWNPNADGTVNVVAVLGSTVFAAGSFSHIGGTARNQITSIDDGNGGADTGLALAWNPAAAADRRSTASSPPLAASC